MSMPADPMKFEQKKEDPMEVQLNILNSAQFFF
jgi:hypothetical protein